MSLIHEKFDHIMTPSKKMKQDGNYVSQKEPDRTRGKGDQSRPPTIVANPGRAGYHIQKQKYNLF
jgi:hypothetical protein